MKLILTDNDGTLVDQWDDMEEPDVFEDFAQAMIGAVAREAIEAALSEIWKSRAND